MTRSNGTNITLAKSTLVRLSDSAREVTCESGSLWITLDADPRDILLEPGQRFRSEGSASVIVYALADTRMTVQHDVPMPSPARRSRWSPARAPVNG